MRILALPGSGMRFLNPYCYLLYSNMEAEVVDFTKSTVFDGRYDIFHLHWPESDLNTCGWWQALFRLTKKIIIIDLLRQRGTSIVWTAHNLKSHEQRHPKLESWFWNTFTKRLSGVIALTEVGLEAARGKFKKLQHIPGFVISHGHYRGEYRIDPALDARTRLGVSPLATVLLFFGQIRPYKGIDTLIELFQSLPFDTQDVELWIVGDSRFPDYAARLKKLAIAGGEHNKRIHLHLHFIPPEDVQLYFGIADLVALPYKAVQNSGTAMLALSFNRPILVPKLGAMEELSRQVGQDWVHTYEGDLTADVLLESIQWARSTQRSSIAPLEVFDWKKLSADTLDAFTQICGPKKIAAAKEAVSSR